MSTRRQFIKQSITAGATLAFGGCRSRPDAVDHATAIQRLRQGFKGHLVLPDDEGFESARSVFFRNAATLRRPHLVARCATAEDVTRCLEFADREDLPVAVRGGGHSFAGWGVCDDGIVIDTSLMKSIQVDAGARTARVEAGVLGREFASVTLPHRLAPVLGECATVGVVGLTLGGGLGWLSGKHGAACDNLLSAELVTADGRHLRASATEHADLFWAIRGGGGNYGVVTSLTCQLHPLDDVISGSLSYRFSDARPVLEVFGDVMAHAADALQASVFVDRESEPVISISVCWSGDPREADAAIRPLRTTVTPVADTVRRGTLMDAFVATTGPPAFGICKGSYLQSLSGDAIETILDGFAEAPGPVSMIGLDHYMHGEVCRVSPDSTAFELRTRDAVPVWVQAIWEDAASEASLSRWVDQTWTALRAHSGGRAYANYPAAGTAPSVGEVYQENYPRLVAVKTQYDPKNVFHRNFNVQPRTD